MSRAEIQAHIRALDELQYERFKALSTKSDAEILADLKFAALTAAMRALQDQAERLTETAEAQS